MAPKHIWTIAEPGSAAVELAALKEQCKVTSSDENALLERIALAATVAVEKEAQRVLVRRQAVLRCACLPDGRRALILPGGAVSEVSAMTIDGAPFAAFEVIGDSPARMIPAADWPAVTQDGYPVSVTYTVGPAAPPADLAAAVFLMAAEMFERRSDGSADGITTVPIASAALIGRRRILAR